MLLLDRDDQMQQMREALRLSLEGQGQVVAVTGEAGIGKTSLVRTFLSDLPADIRILRGACDDLSVAEPLGALRDLAREAGWSMPEETGGPTSRLALFSAALVQFAAAPAGTVVVIEDLHWADEATVDLVRYMARRVPDNRLLLIVTARLDDSDAKILVRRALGDTPPDRMNRLALSRLSREAVARLCRSQRNPDAVFEATAGNAFYVTELLNNEGEEPPLSVQDAVLSRADRLNAAGRAVLDIVCIFPGRAEIAHVTALAGDDAGSGIEDCLDRGLLETDESALSFRHELARQAVLAALRPDARKALNARLCRRLGDAGNTAPSRLLHHAHEARNFEAVAHLAPRAARAAAELGSWREAAACFNLAVEAIGGAADIDLLEEAAWAEYLVGRYEACKAYQERAVALLGAGDDTLRAGDGMRKLSRYRWGSGDFIGAFEAAEQAVAKLSGHRGPKLALALSSVAQLNMLDRRFTEVEAPAREAMAIAEEHGRRDIISHALNNLAMASYAADLELSRRDMARSLEIALDIGSIDHAARAYTNWGHFEFYSCEFQAAREIVDVAIQFGRENELEGYRHYMLGLLARLDLCNGRWDDVVDIAAEAFDWEVNSIFPNPHRFNGALALFSHGVRTGTLQDDQTEAYLRRFDSPNTEAQRLAPVAASIAERAWIVGDGIDEAVAMLKRAVARTRHPEAIPEVHLWLHRLDASHDTPELKYFPEPYRHELSGDWARGAASWERRNAPYDQALALAFGDAEACNAALGILEGLGAAPVVECLRREMRGRGYPVRRQGPRQSTSANPVGLTRRQMEVLRLLDEGLTNGEIAERLFVSPKTVDHHVSAILGKLDVGSRGQAAATARTIGLI